MDEFIPAKSKPFLSWLGCVYNTFNSSTGQDGGGRSFCGPG